MEQFRGQHILVTGATGNVGRAVVETLVACGAAVSAAARRRTALDGLRADLRQSDRLHVAEADVADAVSVERLFDALERGTGPLDAVVHTVGGFAYGALAATEDKTIETLSHLVWLSSVLVTRAAVRRMVPRQRGRVVLIGGLASEQPSPNMAVYGAMKAAVAHFARSVAAEVRASGVTVNVVLPGVIDTPENRAAMPDADPARWVAPQSVAEAVSVLLGESGRSINGALVAVPDRT